MLYQIIKKKTSIAITGQTKSGRSPVEATNENNGANKRKMLFYRKGITFFSKRTERTFFFILTIVMLLWGLLVKLDLL